LKPNALPRDWAIRYLLTADKGLWSFRSCTAIAPETQRGGSWFPVAAGIVYLIIKSTACLPPLSRISLDALEHGPVRVLKLAGEGIIALGVHSDAFSSPSAHGAGAPRNLCSAFCRSAACGGLRTT